MSGAARRLLRWDGILALTSLLLIAGLLNAQEDPALDAPPPPSPLEVFGQRLGGIDEQLKSQQTAIEGAQKTLTDLDTRLNEGLARIDPLSVRLDGLAEELKRADQQLEEHEARLEENGIKLFETLMGIGQSEELLRTLQARLDALSRRSPLGLPRAAPAATATSATDAAMPVRHEFNPLTALLLGLGLPAGAILFLGRSAVPQSRGNAISNGLLPWLVGSLAYGLIGIGLMLGASVFGLIGQPLAVLSDLWSSGAAQGFSELVRTLSLQLPLAGFAALLLCSASLGRLGAGACLLAALVMGALLYPLVGHWTLFASGADTAAQPIGWLAAAGVHDTGRALELAVLGGAASLALAWGLGSARPAVVALDKQNDTDSTRKAVGALLLWAAWLAAVMTLSATPAAAPWLALAAMIAAAGALVAVVLAGLVRREARDWEPELAGGLLVGVLAAAVAYPVAGMLTMLLLGLLGGAVYALFIDRVRRRLGMSADLALAFALGGGLGVLTPGLFGPEGLLVTGVPDSLARQALGLAVVLTLALLAGLLLARLLRGLPGTWGRIKP